MIHKKTYATFDGGERMKSLPGLCLELLSEQKKAWLDLRKGCDSLRDVRERDISCGGFSVRLQYNPGRIKSSLAAVGGKDANERRCFLCLDHLPGDQKGILYRGEYLILCNPIAPPEAHARLLAAFGDAVRSGEVGRLAALLREDAVLLTDGGGRKIAALNPIFGADRIARFFMGRRRKQAGQDVRLEPAMINGAAGALLFIDGEFDQTISLAIDGDRIAAIYLVRNPDKLRHVPAAAH